MKSNPGNMQIHSDWDCYECYDQAVSKCRDERKSVITSYVQWFDYQNIVLVLSSQSFHLMQQLVK